MQWDEEAGTNLLMATYYRPFLYLHIYLMVDLLIIFLGGRQSCSLVLLGITVACILCLAVKGKVFFPMVYGAKLRCVWGCTALKFDLCDSAVVDVGIYLVLYSVLNCLYIEMSQKLPADSRE